MSKVSPHNDDSPAAQPWETWTALWPAGDAYAKACAEWQQEITRFTTARLEEAQEFQKALAKCRTMTDVGKFQQDWAMTVARVYITEATRLASTFAKLMQPKD